MARTAVPRTGSLRVFRPVGADAWNPRPWHPPSGTVVRIIQPHGCPRNGTMGHCYIGDPDTGAMYGLVLLNSVTNRPDRRDNA